MTTTPPDAGVDGGICDTESPPTSTCPDRAGSGWAAPFQPGFAGEFLTFLSGDCRVSGMLGAGALTAQQANDYFNQVAVWTEAFFGCPDPTQTTGPFGFGLIPVPEAGHPFTTADLQLLEDLYVAAINQGLVDSGGPISSLTADQVTQVRAQLASEAAAVGASQSSTYSWADPTTCNTTDGGPITDAGGG